MNRGSRFPRLDRERFAASKPPVRLSPQSVRIIPFSGDSTTDVAERQSRNQIRSSPQITGMRHNGTPERCLFTIHHSQFTIHSSRVQSILIAPNRAIL